MYDLAIIGGGPAGVAAGIYAARKKIKTILIAETFAGQSAVSPEIQNWIGTVKISGAELAKNMENHLRAYATDIVDIRAAQVESIKNLGTRCLSFEIKTADQTYQAKTVLIATGNRARKLQANGAEKFEGKGIAYCVTCDGPLFTDKNVIIVGGGNSAFDGAEQLLSYAKTITLLHRSETLKADPLIVKKVSTLPKIKIILNAQITEIKGDDFVKSIIYENTQTGKKTELPTEGVFVEIGSNPTTEFIKNLVNLDEFGAIIVDAKTQQTSLEGVWAAGDCSDGLYHQNNIAVGDGIKALKNIYQYLQI
ncbi:MAG: FAD-dependent oxidoreductase [Candidatus Pacebacteria bacterium]|nr:FAD-dependent oxidoreductase [Candidatus Paceibacterota bacterium]